MSLPKRYDFCTAEARRQAWWDQHETFRFDPDRGGPVYSIDTPPPTVSGELHIGHVFSYTHADAVARFRRMQGFNVFYPFGFDDNGLPTERLVETTLGLRPHETDPEVFRKACRRISCEAEQEYERIWRRIGLSVDWRLRYTTNDTRSRRAAQRSFLDLLQADRIYRRETPTLWCPECRTAIAQAETEDRACETRLLTIEFYLEEGGGLRIATTRPELLPACVAVFVHPDDPRHARLIGSHATTPLFGEPVPILGDRRADPETGTGAVMCCTFGDTTDIEWWSDHNLPLRQMVGTDGRLTPQAGLLAGKTVPEARRTVVERLRESGAWIGEQRVEHSVNCHERCGTILEFLVTPQWFLRVLDMKEKCIEAGRRIRWRPDHMRKRYEHWVENLRWDWCLSRQRTFGVPFPVWFCQDCGRIVTAPERALPVDPRFEAPPGPCACGSSKLRGETDVMDTWATSSLTPQIHARWGEPSEQPGLLPMSLRPQAHDIIRTWAFYTIVRSMLHTGDVPWREVLISGHALTPATEPGKPGRSPKLEKISKSKTAGTGLLATIESESADAIRYWACGSRPGRDTIYDPQSVANGKRLVTKLYNACRFAEDRISDLRGEPGRLLVVDRWLLSRLADTVEEATRVFEEHDFGAALETVERLFRSILCDNYIEMVKDRLYDTTHPGRRPAQYALREAISASLRMFAPFLPFVTEELYQTVFADAGEYGSIHRSSWPEPHPEWHDDEAERHGDLAVAVLEIVRKGKTEAKLATVARIPRVRIYSPGIPEEIRGELASDLKSASRADEVDFESRPQPDWRSAPCGSAQVKVDVSTDR